MSDAPSNLPAGSSEPPLCVDLDGTLLRTDTLYETFLKALKAAPLAVLRAPLALLTGGKPKLKAMLAGAVELDPASLPYNEPVLEYLRAEKARGRRLVLATASDARLAEAIAAYVGLFEDVFATRGTENLKSARKAARLVEKFGARGFDYLGDATADRPVWEQSRRALVTAGSASKARRVRGGEPDAVFVDEKKSLPRAALKAMRPHQYLKNLLLFVPLATSHQYGELDRVLAVALAFVSFSLCASAVYLLNDLLDLESDRRHWKKRKRPFASGDLSLPIGILLTPALLVVAFGLGCVAISLDFAGLLLLYLVVTTAYSFFLKSKLLIDALTLAFLYTLRIWIGGAVGGVELSHWLLLLSIFLFFSLAMAKRYTELFKRREKDPAGKAHGRGYVLEDMNQIATCGTASGYLATLVVGLYVGSDDSLSSELYARPEALYLVCPILLYWISRVWILANRGHLHDDPIVFAAKDPKSYAVALGVGLVVVLAGPVG